MVLEIACRVGEVVAYVLDHHMQYLASMRSERARCAYADLYLARQVRIVDQRPRSSFLILHVCGESLTWYLVEILAMPELETMVLCLTSSVTRRSLARIEKDGWFQLASSLLVEARRLC